MRLATGVGSMFFNHRGAQRDSELKMLSVPLRASAIKKTCFHLAVSTGVANEHRCGEISQASNFSSRFGQIRLLHRPFPQPQLDFLVKISQ